MLTRYFYFQGMGLPNNLLKKWRAFVLGRTVGNPKRTYVIQGKSIIMFCTLILEAQRANITCQGPELVSIRAQPRKGDL